ncbi:MAG: hypothetical protein JSU94_14115 [Phycisphaerales bacterium]|nr:MAG: hypothetical protein JSU94_14115 [Phycisphaerales bacterium]
MELDRPLLRQCLKDLKTIDFELAYLAALTAEGIKPLSRWEKPLTDRPIQLLGDLGLLTRQITRTVKTGKQVHETIFAASAPYLDFYEKRFAGKPVDKSAQTQLFEGFLFGYPPCCIARYIRRPYAPNNLDPKDQKILFHWACRDCKITPFLLPAYKNAHDLLARC